MKTPESDLLAENNKLKATLKEQNKWVKGQAHLLSLAVKASDKALDALSVTQEEWLLRTKSLEAESYKLKQLLYLIDPAVSDLEMNSTTMRQMAEFERWQREGDKK